MSKYEYHTFYLFVFFFVICFTYVDLVELGLYVRIYKNKIVGFYNYEISLLFLFLLDNFILIECCFVIRAFFSIQLICANFYDVRRCRADGHKLIRETKSFI